MTKKYFIQQLNCHRVTAKTKVGLNSRIQWMKKKHRSGILISRAESVARETLEKTGKHKGPGGRSNWI